jgi:transcriptional regulator with XRE-family HTH domain
LLHMKLGAILEKHCERRGLNLSELARKSGVPKQTLHGWVTGRKGVNLEQLRKVSVALEVSIHELAFGEPDPYESPSEEVLKELFSGDVRVTLHRIERKKVKHR